MNDPVEDERGLGWVALALAAITVLVGIDVLGDDEAGASVGHMVLEVSIIALAVGGLVAVLRRMRRRIDDMQAEVSQLRVDSLRWKADASRWQAEAQGAAKGFSEAVDKEFDRWGLSAAERDVAILLLKGVSLKDIAVARGTAERTARQQAASVYGKAGLSGRNELASYFLDALTYWPPAGGDGAAEVVAVARAPVSSG